MRGNTRGAQGGLLSTEGLAGLAGKEEGEGSRKGPSVLPEEGLPARPCGLTAGLVLTDGFAYCSFSVRALQRAHIQGGSDSKNGLTPGLRATLHCLFPFLFAPSVLSCGWISETTREDNECYVINVCRVGVVHEAPGR